RLRAGDWIVAAAIRAGQQVFPTDRAWTHALLERLPRAMHAEMVGMDAPVAEPSDKRSLHAQTGAAAVDTESHIAARIAAASGVPFVACRAIIDPVDTRLPPAALVGLRPDGTADVAAVFRSVLQQPRQFPDLVRTALDARIARAALCAGRRTLGAGMGFPQFDPTADAGPSARPATEAAGYPGSAPLPVGRGVFMNIAGHDHPASTGP